MKQEPCGRRRRKRTNASQEKNEEPSSKKSKTLETNEDKKTERDLNKQLTPEEEEMVKKLMSIKHSYICPITRSILNDPVFIRGSASEHIMYERSAVESWLENNCTDPFTGKQLRDKTLVVNSFFVKALQEYRDKVISKSLELGKTLVHEKRGISTVLSLLQHSLSLCKPNEKSKSISLLRLMVKCHISLKDSSFLKDKAIAIMNLIELLDPSLDSKEIAHLVRVVFSPEDLTKFVSQAQKYAFFKDVWRNFDSIHPICDSSSIFNIMEQSIEFLTKEKNENESDFVDDFVYGICSYAESIDLDLNSVAKIISTVDHYSQLFQIFHSILYARTREDICNEKQFNEKVFNGLDDSFMQCLNRIALQNPLHGAELGLEYFHWRNNLFNLHDFSYDFGLNLLEKISEWNPNGNSVHEMKIDYMCKELSPGFKHLFLSMSNKIACLSNRVAELENTIKVMQQINEFIATEKTITINSDEDDYFFFFSEEFFLNTQKNSNTVEVTLGMTITSNSSEDEDFESDDLESDNYDSDNMETRGNHTRKSGSSSKAYCQMVCELEITFGAIVCMSHKNAVFENKDGTMYYETIPYQQYIAEKNKGAHFNVRLKLKDKTMFENEAELLEYNRKNNIPSVPNNH